MRPEFVVISCVGCAAQMGFVEDEDVIEAFPTDRADQSFRMPVLPTRKWSRWLIADSHHRKALGNSRTIGCVAVADEMVGTFVPWEGIGDLAGDPLCRGIGRHADRYQVATLVAENDQN